MCEDCQRYFQGLAQQKKQMQVVADPECVRVFLPTGVVEKR
jgi:hypothetical protein